MVQIAKYNSITSAAKELYLTKSAVSTAIKQLEKECGFEILERTYHGVKFTVKGEYALDYAKLVLQILDEIVDLKENCNVTEKPKRRDVYVMKSLMPLLQSKLLLLATGVLNQYNLHEMANLASIREKLNADNLGIVILDQRELEQLKCEEKLFVKEIFSSKYYPASSKATRWIARNINQIDKQDYERLPKIILGDLNSRPSYECRNVVLQTENNSVYITAILNDVGIGIVTDFDKDIYIEKRKLLKVYKPLDDNTAHIIIVMKNEGDLNRANLLEHVLKTQAQS